MFWVDQFGFIYATPDAVGQRTTIASGEATPDSPSWDGASLFWSNNGSGRLRRSPFPNPTAGEVRDIGSSSNDMVVDATNIYYAQNIGPGMDELFVIAKNAGAATLPVKVAAGDIRRLTQNATALFWYDPATGIHVLRKP